MNLSQVVAAYITHRQAMGMRFHTEARTLRSFCRASGDVIMQEITAEQLLAVIRKPVEVRVESRLRKILHPARISGKHVQIKAQDHVLHGIARARKIDGIAAERPERMPGASSSTNSSSAVGPASRS